jgi:LPXTG-site transpeptidase (sortase) family protein
MAALRSTTVRYWSAGLRIITIFFLALSAFGPAYVTTVYADKLVCGVPGKDGPVSISGIVNTYYPGTADVSSGSTSIPVGTPSGAAAAIQPGDLLLVIQMQGADINSTNTDAYGDGVAGNPASGRLGTNFSAGLYEYVVATSAVTGGSVSISSGLVNNYFNQDYSGTQGQRRFQVVRVPQYSSATIVGTVTSLAWTGRVGGVAALDVAGTLNLNGNAVNVSAQGFRGGGGVKYTGATGFSATDYRTLSTATLNASKGEGIAGTPRYVFNGTSVVDNTVEGYPNGSFARGAPGNAGGGGTDGDPAGNEDNAGGGGGGNGGAGGLGGFGWRSVSDSGGFGGSVFLPTATANRLVLGGGGGAGDINNNDPLLSSGGAGGGLVMVRAGTVSGSGTINANGADGQDQPLNDSGGGGGAGGSVLVVSQNPLPGGLNVTAEGGDGGDAWPGMSNLSRPGYPGWRHGPGGGGGGGVILLSSTAGTLSVAQGVHGLTTTDNDFYGSQDGQPGQLGTAVAESSVTTGISGYGCIPHPTVVKTTSTPLVTQTPTGTAGKYTINVTIPAGEGTALGFSASDVLPAGFTYASTDAVNLSGGATRPTTVNPTAGTSNPSWGTFDIPGGGVVQIIFNVNIASTVPVGTYQNPATATYLDPTRTTTNGTTNSQYDPASSPNEDITVQALNLPDLTVAKTNNVNGTVAVGSPFNWTIAVTNSGAAPATFANGQVVMSDALPGASSYYPQGNLTVTPAGAITCTINNTALACTANGTYTLAAGSSFSVTFQVTPTAGGSLANTAVADPGQVMPETNENNNTGSDTVTVQSADLSIVKTDGQASYQPGSVVTYTVTVTNLSGVTANGATVTDARPANVNTWAWACTTTSGGASGCDAAANSANNFTDTVNLPVGGTIVYTVTANVSAGATGNLVNTATVAVPPGFSDPNTGNNTSTDQDTPATADLSVVKTDGQTSYLPGGVVIYTVTVTNLSGDTANGATVTDARPANVTTWAWTCAESGGASGCNGAADSANDFTDTVNLPVGGTIVYTVTANTVANATTNLVNTATVAVPPGFSDPNTGNNTSTDTDTPTPLAADLSITKNDGQAVYTPGGSVTYTVTVKNLSGLDITGAAVSDPKPANITTWTWACTSQTGNATGCTAVTNSSSDFTDTVNLPVGGTIVYTVTANVSAGAAGNLVNTARVDPPTGYSDSDPSNNSSTDTDQPPAPSDVDLSVTKDDGQVTFAGGSVVTYTVTVKNNSGSTATGATVSDPKPANISTWAWTCTMSGGATGCDGAADSANNFTDTVDLPVGGAIVYTVTANVVPNPTGDLANTVTVDPPPGTTDSNTGNNTFTDTDTTRAADLSLTKTASNTSVNIGDTTTFTLTLKNAGPDTAYLVEVTEKLPTGFAYVSSIPSKGTYDNATGVWAVGDMISGAVETLKITVTVNAAGTNVAEITQSMADPTGTTALPDPDSTPGNDKGGEDDLGESRITLKSPDPDPKPVSSFIIPVTGFQPGVATDMSKVPHEAYRAEENVTLEIPSLGVNISIVGVPKRDGTWNVAWLTNEAGWLEGSAFPSWNGNSVLTGHVYLSNGKPGPFIKLSTLKFGDKIIVHAYGQKYTFEVQSNTVVAPTDKSMMKHEDKPWLTLVTCKDYDAKTNSYLNRILVRARLVSVDWE